MNALVIPMAEATDPGAVGGKGAALGRLCAAGFDVPGFFVISPEAFGPEGPGLDAGPAIDRASTELGPGPFAVRSSARDEDGVNHSHAGQLLSLLEVDAAAVSEAAQRVWRSGFSEHLSAYRQAHGVATDDSGPAVVVQQMVAARAAGVAFSADPLSGRRDLVVISAVEGLGDKLVSGEVEGETYYLNRRDGAADECPAGARSLLTPEEVRKVGDLAIAVEKAFGAPQDIEWAFDGDRLFLLQARPITTLPPAALPDDALTIFDNANIVESYPGVVAPLTFSFARYAYAHVYRALLGLLGVPASLIRDNRTVLENLLGRIEGRVYYNLLNWYRTLALLPGFRLNRGYMETMMGLREALPAEVADNLAPPPLRGAGRLLEIINLLRVAFGLLWQSHRLPRTIRHFEDRLEAALAGDPAAISAKPLTLLAADYRALEGALLERWDAPLVNDLVCMIAYGASRKLLERWAGEAGLDLHNDVLIGQGDIVSAEPAQRIRAMGKLAAGQDVQIAGLAEGDGGPLKAAPELAAAVEAYLAKFGDRCTEELKLESIPLTEDAAPLLKAIAAAALAEDRAPVPRVDLEARLADLFRRRPLRRWLARRFLLWAKARVRDRENLRFERTRVFGRVRRLFQAIGRQFAASGWIGDPRDVFFLTVEETLGAIEGGATTGDLAGLVHLRKTEMEAFEARPDPPERIEVRGAFLSHESRTETSAPAIASDGEQQGTGCSAGVVRGPARVVRDPREEVVHQGEIMIARHTDPGWIALFANAAGIAVERGSLLSHSAIVAREMGIPCVVGLKGILDWVETGEMLELDGRAGRVRKLDG